MSNWWSCPRCGARLLWQRDVIRCPRQGCGYHATVPAPAKTDDHDDHRPAWKRWTT